MRSLPILGRVGTIALCFRLAGRLRFKPIQPELRPNLVGHVGDILHRLDTYFSELGAALDATLHTLFKNRTPFRNQDRAGADPCEKRCLGRRTNATRHPWPCYALVSLETGAGAGEAAGSVCRARPSPS